MFRLDIDPATTCKETGFAEMFLFGLLHFRALLSVVECGLFLVMSHAVDMVK